MPEHNFKIGQRLFFAKPGGLNKPDGAYVVVKRLSMRAGEFEYQIKSVTKPDVASRARESIATISMETRPPNPVKRNSMD